jgi:hypothetical protein
MPEPMSMNDRIRALAGRTTVAVTEPEAPAARPTPSADAGAGGGADDHEQRGRDHPVNVAVRDAFQRRG